MDFNGYNILITAGPTVEMWDDIRCLTNISSGRLGYAIARNGLDRGANVTVVSSLSGELDNPGEIILKKSAVDMFEEVKKQFSRSDIFIAAAAVSDFRPKRVYGKIKKNNGIPEIELIPNPDILKWAGLNKESRVIVGFALEDKYLKERALLKMEEKKCDIMIANYPSNIDNDRRSFLLLSNVESENYYNLTLAEKAKIILDRCLKIKKNC